MKKKITLLMIILMLLSLAACTFEKPEDKVTKFLDGVKTSDTEILKGYVDNKYVNLLVNAKGDPKVISAVRKTLFKNLKYEIVSSEKKDGKTVVKVKISNTNFKNVIKDYDSESYSYIIDNLYSGSLNRKNLNAKCLKILLKSVKESLKENKKYTKEVDVELVENDHNAYDLKVTNKLMDAVTGGLISGIK